MRIFLICNIIHLKALIRSPFYTKMKRDLKISFFKIILGQSEERLDYALVYVSFQSLKLCTIQYQFHFWRNKCIQYFIKIMKLKYIECSYLICEIFLECNELCTMFFALFKTKLDLFSRYFWQCFLLLTSAFVLQNVNKW